MGHFSIFGTVFLTVYGLLVMKWRVGRLGGLPESYSEKIEFLLKVLVDPWVLSGFIAALLASLFWITAMTKFDLSYAYPFQILSFVLVIFLSVLLFNEPVTTSKVIGMLLIVSGIFISSQNF